MASSSESHGTHDLNIALEEAVALEKATSTSEPVCTCQACKRPYETDMLVPDDVWEVIKPEGCDIGGGLLCPTCIMDRAADRLGWSVGFVYRGRRGTAVTSGKSAPASEVIARLETILASPREQPAATERALRDSLALISSLVAENEELAKKAKQLQYAESDRRIWRQFYGALLGVPPDNAIPLEVRVQRQASIITSMQSRLRNLRREIRRHIGRDPLQPVHGYHVGRHVNKLYSLWRSSEDRALTAERLLAEAVEQAFRDGLAYGGNVENADPDVAWQHSKARATLSTGGVNG